MRLKFPLFLFFLCTTLCASATHNRSGEITYRHLFGNTYEFTITTCTKLSSEANRTELEIRWGDGTLDTIPRVEFFDFPVTDTKQNYYRGTHTYSGPGSFIISCADPNRNANVLNIANSIEKIFCIQTQLIISPFLGSPDNSPLLIDCPCPEAACSGVPWIYNLGAYDPDGDSLVFSLIPCKGEDCINMAIPEVYQYPEAVGGGVFSIDPVAGTLFWSSPMIVGEYNLAILISEYRAGIRIGYVIRDMQVTVEGVCQNNAPVISGIQDKCIQAGNNLHIQAFAQDTPASPNDNPVIHWENFGEGFYLTESPATFVSSPPASSITGDFSWTPACSAIRPAPYLFTLEASDAGPNVSLKDIETWNVQVNAPPIENLTVSPLLNTFVLSWSQADCPQVKGYRIYRHADSVTFAPENCCAPNFPLTIGYTLIGTTTAISDTNFTDNSDLQIGNQYCYVITAIYANGAESCMSDQLCGQLTFEIPVLTHASVGLTDPALGIDTVRWSHPQEFNQAVFPGPYQYRLYAATGDGSFLPVFTTASEAVLTDCDTFFLHTNLNTNDFFHRYRVAVLNNGTEIGTSATAQTIFLTLVPNDNQIEISWSETVPWTNTSYEVWKETPTGSGNFTLLATTTSQNYTDLNLPNETEFCYRVRSFGAYSLSGIQSPLLNWSNTACAAPSDLTPPCSPSFTVQEQDCEALTIVLRWSNPTTSCAADVTGYRVYYAPQTGAGFTLLAQLPATADTSFTYTQTADLVGCFYITSYDSLPNQNESAPSAILCTENCKPDYQLPNVFTPNGDTGNDLYHPLLPFRFVSAVDLTILNRWGQTVFSTTDPMISWDGTDQNAGELVTEGVYTYLCKVQTHTLQGVKSYDLQGFIHVIYSK
jgi:gliding motility-associated-like protein